jgi:hypothetical protein
VDKVDGVERKERMFVNPSCICARGLCVTALYILYDARER